MTIAALLLAAGAGRRMGGPKALLRDDAGVLYVDRAVAVLRAGGCTSVTVVLGASAADVRAASGLVGSPGVPVVVADDWAEGMGASLRAGLAALSGGSASTGGDIAALVLLVDLPDVTADVVGRVLAGPVDEDTLARATYDGRPGHPVLLGRAHWPAILDRAAGDRGARDYLTSADVSDRVRLVECGDLATGRDTDTPADL